MENIELTTIVDYYDIMILWVYSSKMKAYY